MEVGKQLGVCLHLGMPVEVHLEVALGGEAVAAHGAHEGSLSGVGAEVDLRGAISPKNLAAVLRLVPAERLVLEFDLHRGDNGGFPLPLLDGSKATAEKGLWKRTEPGAWGSSAPGRRDRTPGSTRVAAGFRAKGGSPGEAEPPAGGTLAGGSLAGFRASRGSPALPAFWLSRATAADTCCDTWPPSVFSESAAWPAWRACEAHKFTCTRSAP